MADIRWHRRAAVIRATFVLALILAGVVLRGVGL